MTENTHTVTENAADLANRLKELSDQAAALAVEAGSAVTDAAAHGGDSFLINGLTVFVLACFVGYYVVWRVTPALHSPLMAITNAISSVIIVGALLAVGASEVGFSKFMGFIAVILASINIFGGFIVTRRMLHMFKKKG
ncbi:MAG: NAD(P) transhydrogenase subunit alpha [Rhodospirillales bacterium]|nr:NAD(P) transhydrogenase subunit alpha [Rhodospirillales bacterium]MCB9996661.1 NAD(P) transhydrogenase subunit alpha [Rhodospirillales bacterium]